MTEIIIDGMHVITHLLLSNGCEERRLVACTSSRDRFAAGRGYLAACTLGLPADVTATPCAATSSAGRPARDGAPSTRRRSSAPAGTRRRCSARPRPHRDGLAGLGVRRARRGVRPAGAEVLCVEGDFSSVVGPFLARGDLRVRHVPLDALADAVGPGTWIASYSLVQSATGEVADAASVAEAARGRRRARARRHHAGHRWMPTTDLDADLIVCHAYKWLVRPARRGVRRVLDRAVAEFTPHTAGWYSGADPWASCYGPDLHLAEGAGRFDVSPAWHAWVGAEAALGFAASLDADEVRDHAVGLANAFRERLDLAPSNSAIVTWPDADGTELAALSRAGITASGRAGRARVAFHLWNDDEDVDLAATALGVADARRDAAGRGGSGRSASRRAPCSTACPAPTP